MITNARIFSGALFGKAKMLEMQLFNNSRLVRKLWYRRVMRSMQPLVTVRGGEETSRCLQRGNPRCPPHCFSSSFTGLSVSGNSA